MQDRLRERRDSTALDGPGSPRWRVLLCSLALSILICGDYNASGQQPPVMGLQPDFGKPLSQANWQQTRVGPKFDVFPDILHQSNSSAILEVTPITPDPLSPDFGPQDKPPCLPSRAPTVPAYPPSQDRDVSWKLLVPNTLHDQKKIWSFPAELVRGNHWKPTLASVAATAGLVALDPSEAPYFRATSSYHGFDKVFSGLHTGIGMAMVPASFYAVAVFRHNAYDQHTSLLAGEAVLDSEIVAAVMKSTIRRLRPAEVPQGAGFADTFTDAKGGLFSGQSGFPSGHAIVAFSIATTFANRYSRHRWVPWLAYGLAASVAFSRVTLQAHFTSDVFAGAVLSYTISRYVALRP